MKAARVLKRTCGWMRPASSNTVAPRRMKRKPPPPAQRTAWLMPPCSPSSTFCRRGRQCVAAWSPISMPIQRRPILCATAAVVPEPRKLSRTRSPGLVAMWRMRWIRRSGLGVAKMSRSSGNKFFTSLLPSSFRPDSSPDHQVVGTIPSRTSVRNRLRLGIASPLEPNQTRFSLFNSSNDSGGTDQLRPLAGHTSLPEGRRIA